ncbi:HPr kinase/phosphorylase [Gimibacter soli]|uniref:HPr kinase/phosphatase C-terminal domain-containing protein n=1 Tax=Gimibacter soli TaxID=3024400 RepID=A0AAF0BKE8_9PROT|nr:HPr kinase/phosphatase C-terminal domain-containing protein [Gimibacter soli]WCL54194.1 HPr kinase/phosphatase C-terminal domain-containing protein [Gimibacter soli]
MTDAGGKLYHATLIARDGRGVLLRGASASGKSDLGLRLIDRGGMLVADDQVWLTAEGGKLTGMAPDRLRGLIEVRGLGIISLPVTAVAPVSLVVDLDHSARVPRLPAAEKVTILGVELPRLRLNAFEASAPIKVELALDAPARIGQEGHPEETL